MLQTIPLSFQASELVDNILTWLLFLSCFTWCLLRELVGEFGSVCTGMFSFVLNSIAGEPYKPDPVGALLYCSSFVAPEATPVRTIPTATHCEVRESVRGLCTSASKVVVSGRNHHVESSSYGGGERLAAVPGEHSLSEAVAVGRNAITCDSVSDADEALVVSEAETTVREPLSNMIDTSSVDQMDIDPWYWQGYVPYEDFPNMMDVDVDMRACTCDVDVIMAVPDDQLTKVKGAFLLQECSDFVVCEDSMMTDALPSVDAKVRVQENMEVDVHSNFGHQDDLYVADTIMSDAILFEEKRSSAKKRSSKKGKKSVGVVEKGVPIAPPNLPTSSLVPLSKSKVLPPALEENEGSSEGRSRVGGSSSVEHQGVDSKESKGVANDSGKKPNRKLLTTKKRSSEGSRSHAPKAE